MMSEKRKVKLFLDMFISSLSFRCDKNNCVFDFSSATSNHQ